MPHQDEDFVAHAADLDAKYDPLRDLGIPFVEERVRARPEDHDPGLIARLRAAFEARLPSSPR
jgi:hypothetical protein